MPAKGWRDPRARNPERIRRRLLAATLIDWETGCWVWQGMTSTGGYGRIFLATNGRIRQAHRVSYELIEGPIPDGLHLDHLCRNRVCVNPAHLEPVTVAENIRRGVAGELARQRHAAMTECRNGHPRTEANIRVTPGGRRCCRACSREFSRRYRRRVADEKRSRLTELTGVNQGPVSAIEARLAADITAATLNAITTPGSDTP